MTPIGARHVLREAIPVFDLTRRVRIRFLIGSAIGARILIEVFELRGELADDPRLALGLQAGQP